jgi:predicted AlkP superfamily phosphohydrolase/phosphomutase
MQKHHMVFALFALFFGAFFLQSKLNDSSFPFLGRKPLKLYWFIPDGMRSDPEQFNIYQWAEEGKLPNIKKLMDSGSYGFSKPTFPSHTPTNFASLLTGTLPEVHGVSDGPMHIEGRPLNKVAIAGFRSTAKKVDPIWKTLEEQGEKVALISVPGSTPPEINKGVVLRGRWGGWGADFHALNFETKGNATQRIKQGRGSRLFFFGPQLTSYIDGIIPEGWNNAPESFSDPKEITMNGWGKDVFAYIYDSTDDSKQNYDRVAFSTDRQEIFSDLSQGEWGDWKEVTLKWKTQDNVVDVNSDLRATIIKLDDNGFFRIRLFYNNLNEQIAQPGWAAEKMNRSVGPMMDFVDNFPPQLIYYPEDKQTFIDEAWLTFDWHTNAISAIKENFNPNVVIHDIYTPNQMLTSRWWMGYLDKNSSNYWEISESERTELWDEVFQMYKRLDDMIGEVMANADENTYIVLSSDHGAVPLDKWVHLNNLFAQKGWLKFTINPTTGEPIIDWENSTVIYLKMAHVYVNPEGLAGDYKRGSGTEYEQLRKEVTQALNNLTDYNGIKPVVEVVNWEDAQQFMQLDPKRVGDLVIANKPGYGWNEEMTANKALFSTPLKTGYKQAIDTNVKGMWTPFIMAGPGIKKSNYLGEEPIDHIDQYPTIMTALDKDLPEFVQGKKLEIFK